MRSMMGNYQWSERDRHRVPAKTVGEIVERIEQADGVCHPDRLVEAARDPACPLHGVFDWREDATAERHRVELARRLVRSLRVLSRDTRTPQPAFVHVTVVGDDGVRTGYMGTRVALANEATRQVVLRDAVRQLQGLRRRYGQLRLAELELVWAAVDQLSQEQDVGTPAPAGRLTA
jgi:hypothetical protein